MNKTRFSGHLAASTLVLALLGSAAPLLGAQPQNPPPEGAYGGGGYGMGPGMMGGYGGWGYGMGPGMMGGWGMGPGMMRGYWWGRGLDLSDEQLAKINKIEDETRKAHWALMGQMMDQQARLRDLYEAPKRDQTAIDESYKTIGKLHQQMYDSTVEARKRIEGVLTKEQQEKLRAYPRWGTPPGK